jgi:lysophospholipase L1-like esterase
VFRFDFRSILSRALVAILVFAPEGIAQQSQSDASGDTKSRGPGTGPVVFTTQQDHDNMLQQLGISKLRPGRSSDAKSPNAANYDEAKANPYPNLPDVVKAANGDRVVSADQWWKIRRPEVVELLEREVYGRVPATVPRVKWEVRETREIEAGGRAAILKHVVGVADNSACPEIKVNISMSLTLPKETTGPVPVLMSFGWTPFEPSPFAFGGRGGRGDRGRPRPPSREDKLIKAGWAYAIINPTTVQDDSGGFQRNRFGPNAKADTPPTGAGLTRGIIGLTNLGQPRKPDDWGALRAWGWGASRALDYLETEPKVDSAKVGIAGVSRYGKAALVAMAFDQRFAMGLIASSGAGGTKLFRRNFGESLENLANTGAYHWMAGNYMKYSALEPTSGRRTADDLPVDAHITLALCAPRLTFVSHGVPEKGDANWLDHQGSFMATIAAQPVFRLLGARDLGRSDDYKTEKMPAVNVDLLSGQLAWRQHDGGHTDEPNIVHFIHWANRLYGRPPVELAFATTAISEANARVSLGPIRRNDANSVLAHQQLIQKTKQGKIDVYFVGDSITRRWGATDYPHFLAHWKKSFHGWNAANFGWGGDTTNNILWRMQNGELEGVAPKAFVLQAGTNDLPSSGSSDSATIDKVVSNVKSIISLFQQKSPNSKIILTAVFPRSQNPALAPAIQSINEQLEKLADGKQIRFVNVNGKLADSNGALLPGMSEDGLHLTERSYEVWADALKPIIQEILGTPAAEDQAPPPTGNPGAQKPATPQPAAEQRASRLTTPGGAEIPEAVRIKRPTTEEISTIETSLAAFVESADPKTKALLKEYPTLLELRPPRANTAVVPNLAPFFRQKHEANVAIAKKGEAEVLFLGDSITDFWRNENGPFAGKKVFDKYFGQWKVANFGIAGDTTQGVLYRLQNGEGGGFQPHAVMLMIGTNNSNSNTAPEIAEGIGAVVLELQKRFPDSKILLLGIFPRGNVKAPVRADIKKVNDAISKLHDDRRVFYMDIGQAFLDADGNIPREIMVDGLHPSTKGYEIWAKAVSDTLDKLRRR